MFQSANTPKWLNSLEEAWLDQTLKASSCHISTQSINWLFMLEMLAWSSYSLRIIKSSRQSSMACWWRTSFRRGACNSSQIWGLAWSGTVIVILFLSWAGWRHMIRFGFSKVRNQIFWESIFSKHSLAQRKKLAEVEGGQWALSSSRIRYNF